MTQQKQKADVSRNISSPYNFVPLNKYVYIPDWADKVSQDIPFEDGEDGWIEVTWENVSPLCVRDASEKKDEKYNATILHSVHVKDADGNLQYFIPGSSLKGMLRSILSVMSYGKMTQYNNKFFGYRIFDGKKAGYKKYQEKIGNAEYGWLERKDGGYFLRPCVGEAETIEISELEKRYPGYSLEKTAWDRNEKITKNNFPEDEENKGYCVFATGQMQGKKTELLIPKETSGEITLSSKVIESFFTVYSVTPDFEKYLGKLKNEVYSIPVRFTRDGNGNVEAIGMGKMFRYPYKKDIKTLVENAQKPTEEHDLCEVVFGWTDDDKSMKGRVQISNAFMVTPAKECDEVKGVFGQPKPSFYPLYVKQDGNSGKYKTYDDNDAKISGRKFYRIHQGASITQLAQPNSKEDGGNKNDKVVSSFIPIEANNKFVMRVNVHNLRKVEIGALLTAITFNRTEGAFHNIGAAKGFGYGKIKCADIRLHSMKFDEAEYCAAFERLMNNFAKETLKENNYCSSESIRTLVGIASEHSDEDVRQMEMDKNRSNLKVNEFDYFSKVENFSQLKEILRPLKTSIDEEKETERKMETVMNKIRMLMDSSGLKGCTGVSCGDNVQEIRALQAKINDHNEKVNCFLNDSKELRAELRQIKMDSISKGQRENEKRIVEFENKVREFEKRNAPFDIQSVETKLKEARKKEEERTKKEGILEKGLSAFLEENNVKGEPVVGCWKQCKNKIDNWQKKNGRDKNSTELTSDEVEAVAKTVERLYSYCNNDKKVKLIKNELKDWKNFDSPVWKEICRYIPEEKACAIFKGVGNERP